MAKKTEKKTEVTFDPNKQYQWQSNESITFTGGEFEVIYKALTTFSAGDATSIPSIIGLIMATNVAQGKLVEYVKNGTFQEATPNPVV